MARSRWCLGGYHEYVARGAVWPAVADRAPLRCAGHNCERPSSRATRGAANSADGLGGEAAEGASHVAFTQPLERAVAELTHPFARDAEHGADLLERVLAAALESEVQAQHLRIARRQRAERRSISSVRKRFMASSSVSGISSATKRSMSERSPSGSMGASRRTSPVLSAASDCTTSTLRPVTCESSSGEGSRRSFWRRISEALMMRERSAVRLSGTRTVRPWRASDDRMA
jgi:hypothetical protein